MGIEKVRKFFGQFGLEGRVREFDVSSATVELAARALGCEEERIAKTLSFKKDNECVLIVCAGDKRVDNKKFKTFFDTKAKMLTPDEVFEFTGYNIGGVCPFAIENKNTKIYCDISLKRFSTVFPACGSSNSAIELSCDELFKYSNALEWIDVCK